MIPGLGRSPGEGKGYPVRYSGLENSIDYTVHGVAKSQTQLSDFHFLFFDMIRIAWASLIAQLVKNLLQCRRPQFNSWVRKITWRRDRLPPPVFTGFPGDSDGKEIYLQCGRPGFDPWVGKIPGRRTWQLTPVFLPGESPWTEESGRLQSIGSQRVGHD